MQGAPVSRPVGAEHRETEQQAPARYRPEAPQSTHEVVTLLSQLDDLEVAHRTAVLYEHRLNHVWNSIRKFYVLLSGHFPQEERKPEHATDQARLLKLIQEGVIQTDQIPDCPAVDVVTGDQNPDFHTYTIKMAVKDREVHVLRDSFAFAFRETKLINREGYFLKLYVEALPRLAEAEAIASKWGIWGPKSRLYRNEVTNSIDRLRDIVSEKLEERRAVRAAAAKAAEAAAGPTP